MSLIEPEQWSCSANDALNISIGMYKLLIYIA